MNTFDHTEILTSATNVPESFLKRFLQDDWSLVRTKENSLGIRTQVSITEVQVASVFGDPPVQQHLHSANNYFEHIRARARATPPCQGISFECDGSRHINCAPEESSTSCSDSVSCVAGDHRSQVSWRRADWHLKAQSPDVLRWRSPRSRSHGPRSLIAR